MKAASCEPEQALSSLRGGQGPMLAGAALALAASALVSLLGLRLVQGARVEVGVVEAAALRIDATQEVATPDFARRPPQGHDVPLGPVLVNLPGSAPLRYARCSLMLTVTDPEAWRQAGAEQIRAREAISTLLAARTLPELLAPGGLESARDAVRARLQGVFAPGLVTGVHFVEFIAQ